MSLSKFINFFKVLVIFRRWSLPDVNAMCSVCNFQEAFSHFSLPSSKPKNLKKKKIFNSWSETITVNSKLGYFYFFIAPGVCLSVGRAHTRTSWAGCSLVSTAVWDTLKPLHLQKAGWYSTESVGDQGPPGVQLQARMNVQGHLRTALDTSI